MKSWLFLGIALISCKGDKPAPAPAPAAPPAADPTDIQIVTSGAAPLAPLRYALAKHAVAHLQLDLATTLDAGEIKNQAPALHLGLDIAVDDVLPDGRMNLVSTITSLSAAGEPIATAHANTVGASLAGAKILATLSPDGHFTAVRASEQPLPTEAKAQLAEVIAGFQQLAMPLPADPVGVGARWRSTRPLAPAGTLVLDASTEVELTAREGSTIHLAMQSDVHGADQTAVQDGVALVAKNISGHASGKLTLDLAKLALDATQTNELHMDLADGSDRTPMTMRESLKVTTGSAAAPPPSP